MPELRRGGAGVSETQHAILHALAYVQLAGWLVLVAWCVGNALRRRRSRRAQFSRQVERYARRQRRAA